MTCRHLLISLLLLCLPAHAATPTHADVVVYGSTPGGFCAAIAAAREGASVILVEPSNHVGGMNTGGLSFSDSNQMWRTTMMGLFHEWHLRIQQDYESRGIKLPYDVNVKDQTKWSYEPHVASRITHAMLKEAGVLVLTNHGLQSVAKTGPKITRIVTNNKWFIHNGASPGNSTFTAKVFIDGTYEGDLMAAAGVSWRIGREGRDEFGESLAGKQYTKQAMKIDGFTADGKPLPLITHTEDGDEQAGDNETMTYSFRLSLTKDPANKVQIPEPANYDPARFEVVRRYIKQHGDRAVRYDRYDVPNRKVDGNNSIGGQFSLGLIGGPKGWATANQAQRQAIFEAHKQYTLEFLHFLRTDPVFSEKRRKAEAQWGFCRDEFAATGHFPPQLYVRESRRLEGLHMITQKDIIDDPLKPDPICVSSFPIDSHDCRRIARKDGTVINEGTIFPVRIPKQPVGYPYHVPYRSILPKPGECTNLLVPVALSSSHVAMSSLRIEGAWMLIGQSSGIAAAIAAKRGIPVQDLPYADLKPRLLAHKQVLKLPEGFLTKP